MNISLITKGDQWKGDCILLPSFTDATPLGPAAALPGLSWLDECPAFIEHSGRKKEITLCFAGPAQHKHSGLAKAVVTGLGKHSAMTLHDLREGLVHTVRFCREKRYASPAISLAIIERLADRINRPPEKILEECLITVLQASYNFDLYRSFSEKDDDGPFNFKTLYLLDSGRRPPAYVKTVLAGVEAVAEGIRLTRDLTNGPANEVTPGRIAEEAIELAKKYGFICRVLDVPAMRSLGMNALLAVGQGSRNEPRLIILEHKGTGAHAANPLVFIGKGITFDTGGISLKPSAGMQAMKGDMAGAAAVLGVFEAIGRNPALAKGRIIGILACAENMPDGAATRPGDIVRTMKGSSVEIVNTDAEGRLALCDALTYAQKEWSPRAIVDVATLTGACVVALGTQAAGLFCNDDELRESLRALGEETGEICWPMPLWDTLRENLKSAFADIANAGPRYGGAISAALFLKHFVDDSVPWAHLDIAGPGYNDSSTSLYPAGATGFGVRTLVGLAGR